MTEALVFLLAIYVGIGALFVQLFLGPWKRGEALCIMFRERVILDAEYGSKRAKLGAIVVSILLMAFWAPLVMSNAFKSRE